MKRIGIALMMAAQIYIAYTVGTMVTNAKWKQELIERCVAHYHPKTGVWEWDMGFAKVEELTETVIPKAFPKK